MKNPYSAITELKVGQITDTKIALFNGIGRLLCIKPCHEIKVKELVKEANISRAAFYICYKNIGELIEELENYHIMNVMKLNDGLAHEDISAERYLEYYRETIDYIEDNKELFYAFLITNVNNRFIEKWKSAIKYHLLERESSLINKKNGEFILEMAVTEVIIAYTYWLKNPYEIDIIDMDKIVSYTINLIKF